MMKTKTMPVFFAEVGARAPNARSWAPPPPRVCACSHHLGTPPPVMKRRLVVAVELCRQLMLRMVVSELRKKIN
jgi:hypothetical protein